MPEPLLNLPQTEPALDQPGGTRVPQCVNNHLIASRNASIADSPDERIIEGPVLEPLKHPLERSFAEASLGSPGERHCTIPSRLCVDQGDARAIPSHLSPFQT